ncbi:MAG TPA: hypothetical protein VE623_17640 [Acidimicrobiales bacterium]|nr:hypothetical protein [Acidimicrobiales bacterium]
MEIELQADLNAQDDDGLGWSTLADAANPERVKPGALFLAGNRATILPGSVDKNRHLLGGTVA